MVRPFAPVNAVTLLLIALWFAPSAFAGERPNILWLVSEDNGPHLGCYGDPVADTPRLDALAARGVTYRTCWSTVPVCAPARTALITGMYPVSLGAQHMRSLTRLPEGFRMFPQLLRDAGYYCVNRSKEDFNLRKPGQVWDALGGKAHWRTRPDDAPFFAVFNFAITHESRIRQRPHDAVHDPALVRVPAHHPDLPDVRRDWAQYHDRMTQMDRQVGRILDQLEADGLADDTIVFYFADHGCGLPRHKRSPLDSGLRVPLIVHVPERFRHLAPADYLPGGSLGRLVSFVDFAPTVLGLAGIDAPSHYHGRAFLGDAIDDAPSVIFGMRGRMDERTDFQRSVRNDRFVYIRNYLPHLPAGQHVAYMFETGTTRAWFEAHEAGTLTPETAAFWLPRAAEELYDLEEDPDEVSNLAGDPRYAEVLETLRGDVRAFSVRVRDLGFLPEEEIHARAGEEAPYLLGLDDERYPLATIMSAADRASRSPADPAWRGDLARSDSAVRYWAVMGRLIAGGALPAETLDALRPHLADPGLSVRIAAAEVLARDGTPGDRAAALEVLLAAADLAGNDIYVVLAAWNALDRLDELAEPVRERIEALPVEHERVPDRLARNLPKLRARLLADLDRHATTPQGTD